MRVILCIVVAFATIVPSLAARTNDVYAKNLMSGLCSDTGCRGLDVYDQQCDGSVSTVAQQDSANGYVTTYLRKSDTCNAMWSRAVKSSSYSGNWMLSEALECVNNDCRYTASTPPPNPSTYFYYYPWSGNKQTASPGQSTYWYGDMVAGSKKACARGWVYTSNPSDYVTNSNVYRSWACNDPGN